MEARALNYPDALQMASILSPYIVNEDWDTSNISFVGKLIDIMNPMDFFACLKLLSPTPIKGDEGGEYFLGLLHSGFEKNKILSLIEHYRKIGTR